MNAVLGPAPEGKAVSEKGKGLFEKNPGSEKELRGEGSANEAETLQALLFKPFGCRTAAARGYKPAGKRGTPGSSSPRSQEKRDNHANCWYKTDGGKCFTNFLNLFTKIDCDSR